MSSTALPPGTHPALAELSGTVLESRYQLGRILGAGGMGAVFEATHLRLDRLVAIKVLRPVFVGHDEFIKRFLREAKAASKIRHRNVVEILDFGEASGSLVYSVMEFLEGQDLEDLLRAQPDNRLPWSQTCNLLVQVASGLKAAHACGVIHRDIKPANCFLTHEDDEPVVKLVDFGIAKVEEADQSQQLTGTSQVLGTPNYIAPELVRTKRPASAQSDIYSLGVLAYRMLTGRLPFLGETVFEVLRRSCFDPVPPLRERAPDLPRAVETFVLTLLEKDPSNRPPDMLAVRDAFIELGRDTLAPREIAIPSSAALSLDPPVGVVDSPDVPTLRRNPADNPVAPPLTSTLRLEPAQSPVAGRAQDETRPTQPGMSRLLQPSSGGPRVIDHALAAPREDLPTLPSTPAPPLPAPRRHSGWIISGSLAALGALGLGATLLLTSANQDDGLPATTAQATKPGVGASLPATSSPPSPARSQGELMDPEPSPPSAPSDLEPMHELDASAGNATPEVAVVEPSPAGIEDVESKPSEPPAPEPSSTESKLASTEPPKRTVKPRRSGPPADDILFKRLKGKIKAECNPDGNAIKVTFRIRPDGRTEYVSATPAGEASRCAEKRVKEAKFRLRDAASSEVLGVI